MATTKDRSSYFDCDPGYSDVSEFVSRKGDGAVRHSHSVKKDKKKSKKPKGLRSRRNRDFCDRKPLTTAQILEQCQGYDDANVSQAHSADREKSLIKSGVEENPGMNGLKIVRAIYDTKKSCEHEGAVVKAEFFRMKGRIVPICGECRVKLTETTSKRMFYKHPVFMQQLQECEPKVSQESLPSSNKSAHLYPCLQPVESTRSASSVSNAASNVQDPGTSASHASRPVDSAAIAAFEAATPILEEPNLATVPEAPPMPMAQSNLKKAINSKRLKKTHVQLGHCKAPLPPACALPRIEVLDPRVDVTETGFNLKSGIVSRSHFGLLRVHDEYVVPQVKEGPEKVVEGVHVTTNTIVDNRSLLSRHLPLLPHRVHLQRLSFVGIVKNSWLTSALVLFSLLMVREMLLSDFTFTTPAVNANRVCVSNGPSIQARIFNAALLSVIRVRDRLVVAADNIACAGAHIVQYFRPGLFQQHCPSAAMIEADLKDRFVQMVLSLLLLNPARMYTFNGIVSLAIIRLTVLTIAYMIVRFHVTWFRVSHCPHWTGVVLAETVGMSYEDTLLNLPMIIRRSQSFALDVGILPELIYGSHFVLSNVLLPRGKCELWGFQMRPLPSGLIGKRK